MDFRWQVLEFNEEIAIIQDVTANDFEKIFEATYKFSVYKFLSLQPDIQYFQSPNEDPLVDDALTVILRATFDWES